MTRWNLRTGTVQAFTSVEGPASGVNARGDLVNDFVSNGGASVIRDGQPLQLPVGQHMASSTGATWISDDGRTVIGAIFGTGPSKAAIWHC